MREVDPRAPAAVGEAVRSWVQGRFGGDVTLVGAPRSVGGWAQVEMLHAGAFAGTSSSADRESRVPHNLGRWLRRRFEDDLRHLR